MIHVMVDLEALGNAPHNGTLIAIGAQAFTMDNDIPYPTEKEFEVCADKLKFFYPISLAGQSSEYGFIVEDDTLTWWLADERRNQLAQFLTSHYVVTIRHAFEKFAWWISELCHPEYNAKDLMLWSHGVTYDCVHLEQKWPKIMGQSFNRVCPYKQMRDTRTIFAAYEKSFGKSAYPDVERKRHHHPLEDAWIQAVAVQTAWKGLTRGG